MKKLLIAFAAALFAATALNAEVVYDFAATLHTTGARTATQTSAYSYGFGFAMNSCGEYWYTSDTFTVTPDGKYLDWSDGTYSVAKLVRRVDSTTGRGQVQTSVFNGLGQEVKEAFVRSLAQYGDYADPSDPSKSVTDTSYFNRAPSFGGRMELFRGKAQWCMTVRWTNKVASQSCFRTPSTVKLVGRYRVYDCCGGDLWIPDWSQKNSSPKDLLGAGGELVYDLTLRPTFVYRFGAVTLEKATRVEFVAQVGNHLLLEGANCLADTPPILVLAGQGSCGRIRDSYGNESYGIQSVSGTASGVWIDPTCAVCCGGNPDAVVFSCREHWSLFDANGNRPGCASKDITEYGSDNVREPIWGCGYRDRGDSYADIWGTAAYGTFTLKYNQKESKLD